MEGSRRLLLLAVLLPAVVAAVGPQPGAPCEPTLLAEQVALFCAPGMPPARCCERVVLVVDLGVPCVCRVAAEPQLVTAGLNVTHLVEIYGSCGGAHLAAACEGPAPLAAAVASSTPPSPPSPAPRCTKTARDAAPQPLSSEKPSSPPLSVDLDLSHEATSPHATTTTTPPPHSAAASSQGAFIFVAHFATSPPPSSEKPPSSPLPSSKMPSPPPQQNGGAAQDDITPVKLVFLVLGYLFTGVLFLSPIPIINEIFTTGEVGLHKPDLFIITLVSCVVGLLYGVPDPIKLTPVIFNIVGIMIQIVYLVAFFRSYAAENRWKLSIAVVGSTFTVGMIALCIFLLSHNPRRIFGIIGVVITTGMYAGPIRQVVAVWRTNNVAHMSFWVAGAAFLSGVFRTVYASLTHDWLNLGPYIVGAISGLGQLTLFIWVKFRYPQLPAVGA